MCGAFIYGCFLLESINAIDFPLNAKIAQFSFNCRFGCKGLVWEVSCFLSLQINHLSLAVLGRLDLPSWHFTPLMLGTEASKHIRNLYVGVIGEGKSFFFPHPDFNGQVRGFIMSS